MQYCQSHIHLEEYDTVKTLICYSNFEDNLTYSFALESTPESPGQHSTWYTKPKVQIKSITYSKQDLNEIANNPLTQ